MYLFSIIFPICVNFHPLDKTSRRFYPLPAAWYRYTQLPSNEVLALKVFLPPPRACCKLLAYLSAQKNDGENVQLNYSLISGFIIRSMQPHKSKFSIHRFFTELPFFLYGSHDMKLFERRKWCSGVIRRQFVSCILGKIDERS